VEEFFMGCLSQTIAGVSFKNPIIVASGPLTRKASLIRIAEENGAAGVSTKLCLSKQPFHGQSRWYFDWETKSMGACGERRLDLEEGEALIRQARKETSLVILANMSGSSDDIKTWGETARRLEQAGAHFIELNMVCPNLGMSKQLQDTKSQSIPFGAMVGGDPVLAAAVTQCVKAAVTIPVSCKLTTVNSRIVEVARACEEAGADVLTISSGALGSPGLDIYAGGKSKVAGIGDNFACGGAGGPWAHAISNRAVADVRRATRLPIIGVGGIWKWEHIVESIMYGSSLVKYVSQ
jgi:dihydroorotate dehydrogenase